MNYTVYAHISPNNKIYIGITCQKPKRRWRNGTSYRHNKYFTKAIEKYGWENFQHEIIASNIIKEEAENFERILIEKLNTQNPKYGYNQCEGGYTHRHSEKTKKLLSEIKGRKVCQYDTNFNFIREYSSIKCACKELNLQSTAVYKCCEFLNGFITAGGYIWIYKDEEFLLKERYANKIFSKYHNKNLKKIKVSQYDIDGNFIETYGSLREVAKKFNDKTPSHVSKAIKENKPYKGYIWKKEVV